MGARARGATGHPPRTPSRLSSSVLLGAGVTPAGGVGCAGPQGRVGGARPGPGDPEGSGRGEGGARPGHGTPGRRGRRAQPPPPLPTGAPGRRAGPPPPGDPPRGMERNTDRGGTAAPPTTTPTPTRTGEHRERATLSSPSRRCR